ncbi:cell division protein FtsW [Actinobaculum suis]|nr:cell division protein FtsW [Actinobaculum suis]OCA93332.1 cell division protein FtsW [Actinobaculum suis]OCA94488.1 cell division protein FtsW [Actinobaculum suis]
MRHSIIMLAVATLVLTVLGLVMVFSAVTPGAMRSAAAGATNTFRGVYLQIFYACVGIVVAAILSRFPIEFFRKSWAAFWAGALLLQCLVFSPLGVAVAGNRNWVALGPIRMQPSEFLKLATIIALAATLVNIRGAASVNLLRREEWEDIKNWVWPIAIFLLSAGLVGLGHDMGTVLVFALFTAGMLWLAGMAWQWFAVGGLAGILGTALAIAVSLSRLARVQDFFENIFTLPAGGSPTQADYALWAFGSGGLGGSGLGTGIEKWPGNLAEAQTDFIFAVVGEELGFLGCAAVVILFLMVGISLVRICIHHPSRFAKLTVGGIALWLCGQALANMLVVTSMLPVFGVPLPFMSQGGSSVISCLMAVGVAISAAFSVEGVRASFKQRPHLVKRVVSIVSKTR